MGFEQLAALRDQLAAERAAQEKNRKAVKQPNKPAGKARARPVQTDRPANEHSDERPSERSSKHPNERPNEHPHKHARGHAPEHAPRDPVLIAIARLQQHFPQAFPKKPAPRVALKLGIIEDLNAQAERLKLSADEIKAAIATWCGVSRYWAALTPDAARVDLNGESAGVVTAQEAAHARFLTRRQRKQREQAEKAKADAAPSPEMAPQVGGEHSEPEHGALARA